MTASPPYDEHERRAAARVAAEHSDWLVMWGPWSRRYWAIPVFETPSAVIVSAASTGKLRARMADAELASGRERRPPRQTQPDERSTGHG